MNTIQTNYQALVTEENEAPHESVIFHAASEGGKSHWNHVGDLDSFFRGVYSFQQKHGYQCIVLELLTHSIFTFLILLSLVYCMNCIHFNFDSTDIEFHKLFIGLPTCVPTFGFWTWFIVVSGIILILCKCYHIWYIRCCYHDIDLFYSSAMKISNDDVNNITWHEVQCRLREVQHEQQMCVHKSDLTELDIYHRILRNQNYLVAMVNKNILPLRYNIKFIGEWVYLSSGLLYNIQMLLFGNFSCFYQETGKLKENYKKYAKRKEAAKELEKYIFIFGIINLVASPMIFLYQLLYYFGTYSGVVRYSPSYLSTRKWSLYGRLYLRHFNELDHELHARLSRAFKPSKEYMKCFQSPKVIILSRFFAQILGCIMVFLFIWSLFNEKLLSVNYVLFIITVSMIGFGIFWNCVPHENAIFYPNQLMQRIIADIHYVPDHFKLKSNTSAVKNEFCQLYQYTAVSIFEHLISPFVTPWILLFRLRPRALDIVDFFRCFTVDVAGVGDVCSFALMDVSRHGNHHWLSEAHTKADQHQQAEDGKTELSLLHFTLMNPHWQPPPASNMFINDFRERVTVARENQEMIIDNPYYASLNSLSSMDPKYASLVNSIHYSAHPPAAASHFCSIPVEQRERYVSMHGFGNHVEGPPYLTQGGLLTSLCGDLGPESLQGVNPVDMRAADMSFSALYLHEAHQKLVMSNTVQGDHHRQPSQESENNGNEESPLLDVRIVNYVQ